MKRFWNFLKKCARFVFGCAAAVEDASTIVEVSDGFGSGADSLPKLAGALVPVVVPAKKVEAVGALVTTAANNGTHWCSAHGLTKSALVLGKIGGMKVAIVGSAFLSFDACVAFALAAALVRRLVKKYWTVAEDASNVRKSVEVFEGCLAAA